MKKWTVIVAALYLSLGAGTALAQFTATPIIGGTKAVKGEFPWMVALSIPYLVEDSGAGEVDLRERHCGGTLISPIAVLTAGHCVDKTGALAANMAINVLQGEVDLNWTGSGTTKRKASFVHRSPSYVPSGYDSPPRNDWALIRLNQPIQGVPAATLAVDDSLHQGALKTMGWGWTSPSPPLSTSLFKVDVDFITDDACIASAPVYESHAGDGTTLCAGSWRGFSSCYGDSGGPILKLTPAGDLIQVGITSWGDACGDPTKPTVYAEVQTFVAEICHIVETWGSRCSLAATHPGNRVTVIGSQVTHDLIGSTAKYGTPPYSWSVTGLPPGIEMYLPFNLSPFSNKRAEFIGKPTALGKHTVTVTAMDDSTPPAATSTTFIWNVTLPVPVSSGGSGGDACPSGKHCCAPNPNGSMCSQCIDNDKQCQ